MRAADIAGPSFNAGRYGVAAGTITEAVQNELGIPALNAGPAMNKSGLYFLTMSKSSALAWSILSPK